LVNEQALLHGGRLLSSHVVAGDEGPWIVSEFDFDLYYEQQIRR